MAEKHPTNPHEGITPEGLLLEAPPNEAVPAAETHSGAEQINGLLAAVESRIQYPAAVQQLVMELPSDATGKSSPLWQTFSYISLVRGHLDSGYIFSEAEISSTTTQILRIVTGLQAENLLADEASPGYPPEAREHIIGLNSEYGELLSVITPVIAVTASFSRLDFDAIHSAARTVNAVANLQSLASRNPLNGTPPSSLKTGLQQNPNTAFMEAILRYTRQAMKNLPAEYRTFSQDAAHVHDFIQASQELDAQATVEKVIIASETGELPFSLTEEQLKEFIKTVIPPAAIEPVVEIEFRAFRPDELEKEEPGVTRQGQVVVVEDNKRKIIISPKAIRQCLKGDPSEERLQLELKRILTHEYGHILHTVLPPPLLKQWLDTIQGCPISITRYVRQMRYTKPERVNGEEFSDAVDLFIGRPERLLVLSSDHLKGMDRLYQLCMPGYKTGLRQSIMSRIERKLALYEAEGLTIAEQRQIYIKHELEPVPMPRSRKP